MARPPVDLEIDCPPRVTGGDDVQVNLALTARAAADVAEATIRWVSSWTHHSKIWTFIPARMSAGWSNVIRKPVDTVASSARLPQLSGPVPAGGRSEAKVRMETVDVVPSAVTTDGFGSVLHRVEARVRLRDGTEISQHRKVWVRPRRAPNGTGLGFAADAVIEIRGEDGSPALYGETYRPVDGTLVLRAGGDEVGPGKVDLRLTRNTQWQVHYLMPVSRGPSRVRRDWREKTMERVVSEATVKLGTVATPAVPAHGRAEVGYSFPGPRGTAQTTETPEGFIAWTLDCVWSAGSWRGEGSAPIVISMPVVPARDLQGGRRRRWSWPGRRGGGGDLEAPTGTG